MKYSTLESGKHFDKGLLETELPSYYSNPESIDVWLHDLVLKTLIPLINEYPECNWITIGDGSYGGDCYFLKKRGADVLATDINDKYLEIAKQRGFIDKYKRENAENFSFPNDSFDFVLCKQAYHHFSRPPIAFYEMLRIARKAVILIEPQETRKKKILGVAKDLIKKLLRKDTFVLFEPVGNYIFRINVREVEKMMTSLNYEILAFKRYNLFWDQKLSAFKKDDLLSFPFLLTKLGIIIQNIFCVLNIMDYGLATIIVFKQNISLDLQDKLTKNDFEIVYLPKNPYKDVSKSS